MPITTKALPGLYGGISEQHPHARLETQCEDAVNCIGNVVDGLRLKRPQTKLIKVADSDLSSSDLFVHPMALEAGNFILIFNYNDVMTIFKDDGTKYSSGSKLTIEAAALNYLKVGTNAPSTNLRALTISDSTFLLNKKVTVANAIASSSYALNLALVEFKTGVASQTYKIDIDIMSSSSPDTIIKSYQINAGTSLTTGSADAAANVTAMIPYFTAIGFTGVQSGSAFFFTFEGDRVSRNGADYVCKVAHTASAATEPGVGASWATVWTLQTGTIAATIAWASGTVYKTGSAGGVQYPMSIRTKDGFGNQMIKGYSSSFRQPDPSLAGTYVTIVQKYADLPRVGMGSSHIYEIVGETSTTSGYYVKFDPTQNLYVETSLPYHNYSLDANTMPVILRYLPATDEFTLSLADEDDEFTENNRSSGDNISNPDPSFVGKTISDLFFFKNRLGFIASENICLSKAGDYFDFYATTVTEVLDDDPVDVSVDTNRDVTLRSAVPFEDSMMLFSDSQQFIISSGSQPFTPKTCFMTPATSFNFEPSVPPVLSGPNVYFIEPNGTHSILREYFVVPETVTYDAALLTKHTPTLLPQYIQKIIPVTNQEMLLLPSINNHEIYVYKYQWEGQERIQSAWFKWEFDTLLLGSCILGTTLYLIDTTGNLFSMNINNEDNFGCLFQYHLDYAQDVYTTGILNVDGDTIITNADFTLVSTSAAFDFKFSNFLGGDLDEIKQHFHFVNRTYGKEAEIVSLTLVGSTYTFVLRGDYSQGQTRWTCGFDFDSYLSVSEITARDQNGVAMANVNISVMNWFFEFKDTGHFDVKVTPKRRLERTKSYNFFELDTDTLSTITLKNSGDLGYRFKSYVMCNAQGSTLKIFSDSYMPAQITQMAFELDVQRL